MSVYNILNVADSLQRIIENAIDRKIDNLPISIPVQVTSRSGGNVTVKSLLQYTAPSLPIEDIPIIKSKYYNYPVTVGDIGVIIPISFAFSQALRGQLTLTPIRTVSMQNYCFFPLTQVSDDTQENDSTELTSQNGQNKEILSDTEFNVNMNNKGKVSLTTDEFNVNINDKGKVSVTVDEFVVDIGGNKFTIKSDGKIAIEIKGDYEILSNGKVTIKGQTGIELDGQTIDVGKGATSPAVLGDKLLEYLLNVNTFLSTHTHTGNMGAPTSPPVPPPTFAPPSALLNSTVVKIK